MTPVRPPSTKITRLPKAKSMGTERVRRPAASVARKQKTWTLRGNCHSLRGRREQAERDGRQSRREHVVDPQSEAQKASPDRRQHDPAISNDRSLRERRNDHRHQGNRRKEDDVDLRMAKEPEQVLPQQRIAAAGRIEERPMKRALDSSSRLPTMSGGKAKTIIAAADQDIPDIQRHEVDAHSRRPALQCPDDHLHGRRNGGDLNERESQQPDVGADSWLIARGQRRIHEPAAAWRGVEEDRAAKEERRQSEKHQNPNADRRGNGRSRAPSICGSRMTAMPSKIGIANRNIITDPCTVKAWLYSSAERKSFRGRRVESGSAAPKHRRREKRKTSSPCTRRRRPHCSPSTNIASPRGICHVCRSRCSCARRTSSGVASLRGSTSPAELEGHAGHFNPSR